MARPSKYNPEMCNRVIELMKDGASLYEVAADLDIDIDTIKDWRNKDSKRYKAEFSASLKKGLSLSRAWWEKKGRDNIDNKDFNSGLWFMNMKNRFYEDSGIFRWADKHTTEFEGDAPNLVIVTKNERAKKAIENISKKNNINK